MDFLFCETCTCLTPWSSLNFSWALINADTLATSPHPSPSSPILQPILFPCSRRSSGCVHIPASNVEVAHAQEKVTSPPKQRSQMVLPPQHSHVAGQVQAVMDEVFNEHGQQPSELQPTLQRARNTWCWLEGPWGGCSAVQGFLRELLAVLGCPRIFPHQHFSGRGELALKQSVFHEEGKYLEPSLRVQAS